MCLSNYAYSNHFRIYINKNQVGTQISIAVSINLYMPYLYKYCNIYMFNKYNFLTAEQCVVTANWCEQCK